MIAWIRRWFAASYTVVIASAERAHPDPKLTQRMAAARSLRTEQLRGRADT